MSRRLVLLLATTAIGCGVVVGIEDLTYDETTAPDEASTGAFEDLADAASIAVTEDPPLEAGCTSIGPLGPRDASVSNEFGNTWQVPKAVQNQDGVFASAGSCCEGDTTRHLNAFDFGFKVPENATIQGVKVLLLARSTVDRTYKDAELRLARIEYGGGFGDDLRSGVPYGTDLLVRQYGDATALWGAALSPDVVNAADFGVTYRSAKPPFRAGMTHQLDAISMTVYYCTKPAVTDGG